MSLKKITVEIERCFKFSSTNSIGCHLRFPRSQMPVLFNPNPTFFSFRNCTYTSPEKNKILSSTYLLKEISKMKIIEKKAASVNKKKHCI